MRIRASRSARLLAGVALAATGLGAVSACGGEKETNDNAEEARMQRARRVAAACDGSTAADEWRVGSHPMGDVSQLPRGGLRNKSDQRAYHRQGRTRGRPGG